MLRASWTPVKLPAFGNAFEPHGKPQRAPVADEVLPGLGREEWCAVHYSAVGVNVPLMMYQTKYFIAVAT